MLFLLSLSLSLSLSTTLLYIHIIILLFLIIYIYCLYNSYDHTIACGCWHVMRRNFSPLRKFFVFFLEFVMMRRISIISRKCTSFKKRMLSLSVAESELVSSSAQEVSFLFYNDETFIFFTFNDETKRYSSSIWRIDAVHIIIILYLWY